MTLAKAKARANKTFIVQASLLYFYTFIVQAKNLEFDQHCTQRSWICWNHSWHLPFNTSVALLEYQVDDDSH